MITNQLLDKPRTPLVVLAMGCCLVMCGPAAANETEKEAAAAAEDKDAESEDLAKAVQNPLAALITLPLQANFNDGVGPGEERVFNLNIQPVIPIVGEKWNVITRTIIPLNSVPSEQVVGDDASTFVLHREGDAVARGRPDGISLLSFLEREARGDASDEVAYPDVSGVGRASTHRDREPSPVG